MGLFHRQKELCAREGCNHPKKKHCIKYRDAVRFEQLQDSCRVDGCPCSKILYGYIEPENVQSLFEGKNINEKGEEFWLCGHCENNIKFETREEYVSHHNRVHS